MEVSDGDDPVDPPRRRGLAGLEAGRSAIRKTALAEEGFQRRRWFHDDPTSLELIY
jgi:hypothetical protein